MFALLDKYLRAVALLQRVERDSNFLVVGTLANRRWHRVCALVDGRWRQYQERMEEKDS